MKSEAGCVDCSLLLFLSSTQRAIEIVGDLRAHPSDVSVVSPRDALPHRYRRKCLGCGVETPLVLVAQPRPKGRGFSCLPGFRFESHELQLVALIHRPLEGF